MEGHAAWSSAADRPREISRLVQYAHYYRARANLGAILAPPLYAYCTSEASMTKIAKR